jgi:hypothetical protein
VPPAALIANLAATLSDALPEVVFFRSADEKRSPLFLSGISSK